MVASIRLEGGIEDLGKDYVVVMPAQEFSRLIDLIDQALESHEGFGISLDGRSNIFFRLGMIVDFRISACDDGSLVLSLTKATMQALADLIRPLCMPQSELGRVRFHVRGDHSKPLIQTLVFERLQD